MKHALGRKMRWSWNARSWSCPRWCWTRYVKHQVVNWVCSSVTGTGDLRLARESLWPWIEFGTYQRASERVCPSRQTASTEAVSPLSLFSVVCSTDLTGDGPLDSSRTTLLCRCFIPSNGMSITHSLWLLVTFIVKFVWNCVETALVVKATLQSQNGRLALFQVMLTVTASDVPRGLSKAEIVKNIFLPVAFSCCLACYFSRWYSYS